MAGVSRRTIYTLECGKNLPTWDTRQKIRRALRMPEERYYTTQQRNAILTELLEQNVIEREIQGNLRALNNIGAITFLDDLRQDCVVCAIRAIDRFRPEGEASVATFVKRNVRGLIKNWILSFCMHGMSGRTYPIPRIAVHSLGRLQEDFGFDIEG